jgi:hypothetical protein
MVTELAVIRGCAHERTPPTSLGGFDETLWGTDTHHAIYACADRNGPAHRSPYAQASRGGEIALQCLPKGSPGSHRRGNPGT